MLFEWHFNLQQNQKKTYEARSHNFTKVFKCEFLNKYHEKLLLRSENDFFKNHNFYRKYSHEFQKD